MVSSVIVQNKNMTPAHKVQSLRNAIEIFNLVCTDGNCGSHHSYIARIYTLLSLYLWLDGKKEAAFDALDNSLTQFKLFDACCAKDEGYYTAPLVRLVQQEACQAKAKDDLHPHTSSASLAEDWPWWCVPEDSVVRKEIQADPRWNAWVEKTKQ